MLFFQVSYYLFIELKCLYCDYMNKLYGNCDVTLEI